MKSRHHPFATAGSTSLLVLGILGVMVILGGVVIYNRDGYTDHTVFNPTLAKINTLVAGLRTYQSHNEGILPSNEQGLRALVEMPADDPQPTHWIKIADDAALLDVWGTPFAYHCPGRKPGEPFEIISAGPDKLMNSADDISSVSEN